MKRMTAILMILLLSAVALTGCDTVRAGTRCKAGAAPGRDATHVLFCQGGKWKRVMTIGQAADFILGTIPGAVTPVNATATVKAGTSSPSPSRSRSRAGRASHCPRRR
ncbi:MAG: hypothetical protein V9G12_00345 [Microthrixaceae bacterium]